MGGNKVMRVGPLWIILVPLQRDPTELPHCFHHIETPKRSLVPPTMCVCNQEEGPNQNLTVLVTMISDLQLPEQ